MSEQPYFQSYYEHKKQAAGAVTYGEELALIEQLIEETKQGVVPVSATQRIRVDADHPAVEAIREGKIVSLEGTPAPKAVARPHAKRNALLAAALLMIPILLLVAWLMLRDEEETTVIEEATATLMPTQTAVLPPAVVVETTTPLPTHTPQPTYTPVFVDSSQFDIIPSEPETVANSNNPIALAFAGREMRVTEALLSAEWQPTGVEWWPGTHVRRVIAVPYEKSLVDAAFGLIGQPITLRLRTGTLVQYELTEIKRQHSYEIEHLTASRPSLALVFYGEPDTDERWLLIGEAQQQAIVTAAPPVVTFGDIPEVDVMRCDLNGTQLSCSIRSTLPIEQLHITDSAWLSAWQQTPPTIVESSIEEEGQYLARLTGRIQAAETAVIMTADTVEPLFVYTQGE